MNRLRQLREAGVSIWLDTLSRPLLESGDLALEREGVQAFCDSYSEVLARIEAKLAGATTSRHQPKVFV